MPRICIAIVLFAALVGCSSKSTSGPRPVLMISIDGFKPEYLTQADEHGLKMPYLKKLASSGVYSSAVHGVLPTSTFPAHTTMLTGVSPAKHGIVGNKPFDPAEKPDTWYWFSADIRARTLWDVAAECGMTVGSINWPVSVGERSIQYNIPEYNQTRTRHDAEMIRILAGPALMDELSANAGDYLMDIDEAVPRDWSRTKYAVEMIKQKHVSFITIHLSAADHLQHKHGPFTPEVLASLEETDKMVEELDAAMRKAHPSAAIAIVSDHGFAAVTKQFKLEAALAKEELPVNIWSAGGSAAITLRNRSDDAARAKLKSTLYTLASDEENGIARILDRDAIAILGGTPAADYWVDMEPGYSISGAKDGKLVVEVDPCGTHGYSPDHAEMNAFFLIAGGGVTERGDVGPIDMTTIAPRIAEVMGVRIE